MCRLEKSTHPWIICCMNDNMNVGMCHVPIHMPILYPDGTCQKKRERKIEIIFRLVFLSQFLISARLLRDTFISYENEYFHEYIYIYIYIYITHIYFVF